MHIPTMQQSIETKRKENPKMRKTYLSPEAEIVAFEKEDVITASPMGSLDLPTIDLGSSDREWSEDSAIFKL